MIEASRQKIRNVIRLVQVIKKESQENRFYIVTKYKEGGTLCDFRRLVYSSDISLSEREGAIKHIMIDIARGIYDLHRNGIIHRDIKPMNILIDSKTLKARATIADLGVAIKLSKNADSTKFAIGTDGFRAPEVALGRPYKHSCDVFSLGCVLYWLLTGTIPFYHNDQKKYHQILLH